ncbi:GlsB/YeaQ/YmgE family stress response membrane protein [Corallococcus sp. H22C18031201]|uniref:GlsB/YeaQ/YmgE family stress response membrane protein n=1 Tax=Citreicoccus inhibens TaxID=2849499 RepID=UPI000E7144C8|nr:GlsB/YeaQ/YmgE family stress response membrane protein [Citreicoccus inhibens]MBJ6764721.1 GlsB/YeaQ/YmgE family stress response membrane protein [Myxococcaceae bacterium JPH2]MBU8896809.1 GlsB/YeaQ/YmgE family stress response membrane protein [Citreicoccus inhibens]RJS21895.1 GlsB/YeaQ/YmgE family stress response membrane protein [Corallococcus sp. H22C18031201]
MGLCGWLVFGFFAGLVARALTPGDQSLGCLGTTALGVAGAFVGGFLGSVWHGDNWRDPEPAGFLGSVLGAVVLLWLAHVAFGSRRRR